MQPTLFTIPFLPSWLGEIKSYGVMLMLGFLTGIWMACRRAERSRANPDIILNMGFISLIGGIVGARAMYVIHYWSERFGNQPSPIMAVLDIRAGGLEFLGGPMLVIPALYIYLRFIAKVSRRWYLDIAIPALPWGLALTRVGCFLNGCCWGSVCVNPNDPAHAQAALPWAVRFPYGSGPMVQQYQFGQLTLPKELIWVTPGGDSTPIPADAIAELARDDGAGGKALRQKFDELSRQLNDARARNAPPEEIRIAQTNMEAAKAAYQNFAERSLVAVADAQCRKYGITPQELLALSEHYRAKPNHPTQLYAVITGLLLTWVLSVGFFYRKRHGVLLPWFLILYSIARFFEELLRQDNPLDFGFGGLTISQFLGLILTVIGVVSLWYIYRLPERCPLVKPWDPPDEGAAAVAT